MLSPRGRHIARLNVTQQQWHVRPLVVISLLIAYAGVLLLTYPTAAAWISQYNQSQIVREKNREIENAEPAPDKQITQAHRYNDALNSGAILEANANIALGQGNQTDPTLNYFDLLTVDPSGYMGRILIPSISLDLPIFHGTSDAVLETGIGHLQGTSLPVGGRSTRAVLTGHRGLANAEMFTYLDRVKEGDKFSVAILGQVFTYRVRDIKVIAPEETESIKVEEGKDLMTLITCTPLGINTHRILVTGERLYPTPDEDRIAADIDPTLPHFPWWVLWLIGAAILAVMYLWWAGKPTAQQATAAGRFPRRLRRKTQATRSAADSE